MKNHEHKPFQKQKTTDKIGALPEPRPFSNKMSQGKTEVAPKLEMGANPFHFSHVTVSTVEPALPNSPQGLVPGSVQAKLTIGEPNDRYEQEADNVAKTVVKHLDNSQPDQKQPSIKRKSADVGPMMRLPLQRQSSISVGPASHDFEKNLNQARRGGSPLAPKVQGKMESAMGADFSRVKIHTDSQADNLSQSIQAKAFTTGQDVFFKQGEYDPGSRSGQELLAHELTHVVQQSGVAVQARKEYGVQDNVQRQMTEVVQRDDEDELDPTGLAQAIQTQDDEQTSVAQIKAAFGQWDTDQKNAFFTALPENLHRLALSASMEILEQEGLEYEKGILKTGGRIVSKRQESKKPFYQWLYQDGDEPQSMNCWETVLYAGHKIGKLTKSDIKKLINRKLGATLLARKIKANADGSVNKTSLQEAGVAQAAPSDSTYFIQDEEANALNIPAGKVVVFGREGQHIALSAGGSNIYENDGEPLGNIAKSTLSKALARNRREYGVALYWGDLPSA